MLLFNLFLENLNANTKLRIIVRKCNMYFFIIKILINFYFFEYWVKIIIIVLIGFLVVFVLLKLFFNNLEILFIDILQFEKLFVIFIYYKMQIFIIMNELIEF